MSIGSLAISFSASAYLAVRALHAVFIVARGDSGELFRRP